MDIDLVRLALCTEYFLVFASDMCCVCVAVIIDVRLTGRHDKQL